MEVIDFGEQRLIAFKVSTAYGDKCVFNLFFLFCRIVIM